MIGFSHVLYYACILVVLLNDCSPCWLRACVNVCMLQLGFNPKTNIDAMLKLQDFIMSEKVRLVVACLVQRCLLLAPWASIGRNKLQLYILYFWTAL